MSRFPFTLAVLLCVVTLGSLPVSAQDGSGEEPLERDQVVDITFPISGVECTTDGSTDCYYVDTYLACRSGCSRLHRATDLMAPKLTWLHAAVDGEICYATGIDEPPPSYGYMLRLCGDDGLRYSYVHINNDSPGSDDGAGGPEWAYAPGIDEGVRVERGQWIGYVGDSGNAEGTGPHLHFEIYDADMDARGVDQGRINPYWSLVDAQERGDYPAEPDDPNLDEDGEPTTGEAPSGGDDEPTEEPAPADEGAGGPVDDLHEPARLAGATRIETAVALSRATRGRARAVVIVPAGSYVEALLAAPLAGLIDAPVLLSERAGLADAVLEEIERIDPLSAYLIGGDDQLSAQVELDLTAAGVLYQARLEAPDRYELSTLIAREIESYEDDPDTVLAGDVLLAGSDPSDEARAWPDALAAGALAARTVQPILLVQRDRLPLVVEDALAELRPGTVTVLGGAAAVSETVAEDAAAVAGFAELERLAGRTRYGTSVAIAEAALDAGLSGQRLWVATGLNYPDALAAGPAAATAGYPVVLVDGHDPSGSPDSLAWITDQTDDVVIVGGVGAVSEASALAAAGR